MCIYDVCACSCMLVSMETCHSMCGGLNSIINFYSVSLLFTTAHAHVCVSVWVDSCAHLSVCVCVSVSVMCLCVYVCVYVSVCVYN